ncbi:hypothetical protein D5085_04860 [Ectothiorhodospiraceae bacterium BW-2]|nr:hypothetical protein D5085_04860 [Ectothiorhodospiraceae bacterium BW-2]
MIQIPTPVPGLSFYENVIPDEHHDAFVAQLNAAFYELNQGHYDGFSFADDRAFDAVFYPLLQRLFHQMRLCGGVFRNKQADKPLKLGCTLVGYEKKGYIPRHVDSWQLSGDTVVVFSFNSPCVIHFYQNQPPHRHEQVFIPAKSMYVMQDEARYHWSHEIKANDNHFAGKRFTRRKRYSLLLFEPGTLYREEIVNY